MYAEASSTLFAHFLIYTDPGSGTLIWQLALAAVFGAMFYVRKLKDLILERRRHRRLGN
jgi:hypothetical protein